MPPHATQTTRPELLGTFGMVTSTHWLASQSGMRVLEDGGNAFDAAVAAGLVLHVVEPHLNGLGGDVPLIGQRAGAGEPFVLCGQGTAPAAATPEVFAALGLDHVPGTGLLPAVVPGAFGTWMDLLLRHGTRDLRTVMSPAIGYARDGFPLLPQAAATIARVADVLRRDWPSSAAVWLPGGRVPEPGSRMSNPDLARTLERLLTEGESAGGSREAQVLGARRAFYEGFVAEAIDALRTGAPLPDSTGRPHAGLLRADDLATWHVREERPVTTTFAGRTIAKTGPWGQGPALLQQLRLLEGFDLADTAPGSAELVHLGLESAKLAMADRDHWYADPDHADVPMEDLLSSAYADERRRLVTDEAWDAYEAGRPGGRTPAPLPDHVRAQTAAAQAHARAQDAGEPTAPATPRTTRAAGVGEPTFGAEPTGAPRVGGADAPSTAGGHHPAGGTDPRVSPDGTTRGDTCHLDVVDRWGNVVSVTPSGGWLQSSPVVPGLGMPLSTRAQMFWVQPGLPGSIGPGRRPRTTLSPTLVLRDGVAELACGTPGGDQQDQWQVPFLVHHLVHGLGLQEALDMPTWHTTHLVSSFDPREIEWRGAHVEDRLGEDVVADLRRRGHRVTVTGAWSLGRTTAAGVRTDGMLRAAANARGMQAYAVGR